MSSPPLLFSPAGRVDADARSGHHAFGVQLGDHVAVEVVAVGDEAAGELAAAVFELHVQIEHEDASQRCGAHAGVPVPTDVVQLHAAGADAVPHTDADVAGGRRHGGVDR